jgi:uncharacterized membrane protein YhaH (DUF805 family)
MAKFLFSPYGRISRKTYWLYWILPYLVLMFLAVGFDFALFPIDPRTEEPPPVFQRLFSLALLWPSIAVATKRLHDRGMTGWWNLASSLGLVIIAAASFEYFSTVLVDEVGGPAAGGSVLAGIGIGLALWAYPAVNSLFLRGRRGTNKYGLDPLEPTDPAAAFA